VTAGADASAYGERYCPTCERSFESGERCPDDGTRLVRLATGDDALIGRELDGRYTILERIGKGGMGTVYRGKQHSVGREVAIKVVSPTLVSDPIVIKRFLRESKLSSALSHPNAVSVLDFGQTEDGLFYLIMELVHGRTLDTVLADERTLPPARVVRIGSQIAEALDGAHRMKIVHRDLKPANVMLLDSGRDLVKVFDFGIAKSLTPRIGSATMTNVGALLGTPAYMPPELVTGQETDHRADLYSLGCLLYQMVSGQVPFQAATIHELIALHASERPAPLQDVPVRLARVIEKLLEKNPADRFQTAADARDAIDKALSDEHSGDDSTTLRASAQIVASWSLTPIQGVPRPKTEDIPTIAQIVSKPPTDEIPTLAKPVPPGSDPGAESITPTGPEAIESDPTKRVVVPAQPSQAILSPTFPAPRSSRSLYVTPPPTEIIRRPTAPGGGNSIAIVVALLILVAAGLAAYHIMS
jgi:serine/threonine protein kinase